MRFSQYFLPTLKEDPGDSDIISHSLSIRAGLIRKIASGLYAFLPAGYRVLKKIENIVREEMNNAGAQEILMPVIQPAEIWQQSNRWDEYGSDMFKLADRNERDFCLGPTHEEMITTLTAADIYSYKDLPVNLYQIQVKFRDEIRPRYGLMRAREFIMKDAYSFAASEEQLDKDYEAMYAAYSRIIERIGLKYKVVEADTGLIGGKSSHEFVILAQNGEETIAYCDKCGYAANTDNAKFRLKTIFGESNGADKENKNLEEVYTPDVKTIEELSNYLQEPPQKIIKTIVIKNMEGSVFAFLLSGDRTLNISKAEKYLGAKLEFINEEDNVHKLPIGFVGPAGLKKEIKIYADYSIHGKSNLISGANKINYHYKNVNIERDFDVNGWGNFTYPVPGDLCEDCNMELNYDKGIEVGHIFKLGTKYSEKLNGKFLDGDGKLKPYIMGCYGIGITRMLAAAIEQSHDEKGIIWPKSIAPFTVSIISTNMNEEKLKNAAERTYEMLMKNKVEVIYDDRDISAGIKFKDSDLTGVPVKLIFGKKFLKDEIIDIEYRNKAEKIEIKLNDLENFLKKLTSLNE
ncbi:MAG: proline--tRNA ligase [Actinobacteria bacterium]|nr:proline--tRNA ligase [Actinomycetota bacterium]